ncbi:MAG TPA: glycoside hydrolase family 1 protein, partial [Candidatus Bathyarchaeota archaeon]|nr:glycoside hydrolase family 1 protein [Candidatus Bathyarchaeota archaeon]
MPFPKEFLWGASESGFQFEMGDRERRSLDANTDWYIWVHDKENIERGIVSGDLPENGIDYWDLFKLDHRLAEELGMNAYRVGIEWSRIFPKSTREVDVDIRIGKIVEMNMDEGDLEKMDKLANKKALQRYREIVMDLRRRGFKVFICINHFTLPLWIHNPLNMRGSGGKQGPKGWVDPYTAVEFGKYAGYLAYKFGDIVDLWVTLNEPIVVAEAGFMLPEAGFPPGFSPGFRSLRMFREALKNLVSAHVAAYNMIRNFDDDVSGDCDKPAWVGIVHNLIPTKAVDESREVDVKAAEVFDRLHNRFLLQAITDGWLDLNFNGRKEGKEVYTSFSNKVDWIGINYYSYLA